jgi:hypothetical protein
MLLEDELSSETHNNKFGRTIIPKNFSELYDAFNGRQEDIEHTGLGPNSGMYIIDPCDSRPVTDEVYTSGKHAGEPVDSVHCCCFWDV